MQFKVRTAEQQDFKYHLLCYVKNVENKKKKKNDFSRRNNDTSLRKRSTEIELLSEIEIKIMNGTVLSIADIEVTFKDILENEYDVQEDLTSYYQRIYLKDLILDTIPHAKCVPQKDPRKPHLIYSTLFVKNILSNTLEEENIKSEMNCIFKVAKVIRQSIFEFRKKQIVEFRKRFSII